MQFPDGVDERVKVWAEREVEGAVAKLKEEANKRMADEVARIERRAEAAIKAAVEEHRSRVEKEMRDELSSETERKMRRELLEALKPQVRAELEESLRRELTEVARAQAEAEVTPAIEKRVTERERARVEEEKREFVQRTKEELERAAREELDRARTAVQIEERNKGQKALRRLVEKEVKAKEDKLRREMEEKQCEEARKIAQDAMERVKAEKAEIGRMRSAEALRREKEAEALRVAQRDVRDARDQVDRKELWLREQAEELTAREQALQKEIIRLRKEVEDERRLVLSQQQQQQQQKQSMAFQSQLSTSGERAGCEFHRTSRSSLGSSRGVALPQPIDEVAPEPLPHAVPAPATPPAPPSKTPDLRGDDYDDYDGDDCGDGTRDETDESALPPLALNTSELVDRIIDEAKGKIRGSGLSTLPASVLASNPPTERLLRSDATGVAAPATASPANEEGHPATGELGAAQEDAEWNAYKAAEAQAKVAWGNMDIGAAFRGPGAESLRSLLAELVRLFGALEISFAKRLEFARTISELPLTSAERRARIELQRMRKLHGMMQPLMQRVTKLEQQRAQSQRGGSGNVEAAVRDVSSAVATWESRYKQPFLYRGVRYLDLLQSCPT